MQFLYLAVAAIAPILLIANGKRLLGSSTQPAAIFILAWILCSFLFTLAFPSLQFFPTGIVSFVWIAICYSSVSLVKKLSSRSKPEIPADKKPEN